MILVFFFVFSQHVFALSVAVGLWDLLFHDWFQSKWKQSMHLGNEFVKHMDKPMFFFNVKIVSLP